MPNPKTKLTAKNADRYVLYQASVQEPDADLDFVDRVFRKAHGKVPTRLREDFCGTALTASRFIARRATNTAIGVDLDPVPLAWGRKHILSKLSDEQRARLTLIEGDVLGGPALKASGKVGGVDVVLALNFSYWCFHTREVMKRYFEQARAALAPGGRFILDIMVGSDVLVEQTERTRKKGFTYVWEQRRYDPLSGSYTAAISFEFATGRAMKDAFVYHWRLWTIPELRDILREAGFKTIETYAEGEDANGNGTGVYVKKASCAAERCVLAYVVAG